MTRERFALLATALVGAAVGWFAAFDNLLGAVTFGSAPARAALVAAMAWIGGQVALSLGWRISGHGKHSPVLTGLAAAFIVAIAGLALDLWLFPALLPPHALDYLATPLAERLAYFMPRAFAENILYRLFAFTLLAALAMRINRNRVPGWPVLVLLLTLVQAVNISANVGLTLPHDLAGLAYLALRFVLPGVIWGVLYVRNGFTSAEIASVGVHIFLQPGFSLLRGSV